MFNRKSARAPTAFPAIYPVGVVFEEFGVVGGRGSEVGRGEGEWDGVDFRVGVSGVGGVVGVGGCTE